MGKALGWNPATEKDNPGKDGGETLLDTDATCGGGECDRF